MELPKRKSIRLKGYDYSSNGAYFITICTHNRKYLFGEIIVGEGSPLPPLPPLPNMTLNTKGNIINEYINMVHLKYDTIKINKYIIMPNHIHLIVVIDNRTGNPSPTIGNVMGWFKYQTTKQINEIYNTAGEKLWQRSYHDHIIRNEKEYQNIWRYIDTNPKKWAGDCYR